jgi:hypothetical protein
VQVGCLKDDQNKPDKTSEPALMETRVKSDDSVCCKPLTDNNEKALSVAVQPGTPSQPWAVEPGTPAVLPPRRLAAHEPVKPSDGKTAQRAHEPPASKAYTTQGAAHECAADHPNIFASKQSEGVLNTSVASGELSSNTAEVEDQAKEAISADKHIRETMQETGVHESSCPEIELHKEATVESHVPTGKEVAGYGSGEHKIPMSADSSTESTTLPHAGKTGSFTGSNKLCHADEISTGSDIIRAGKPCMEVANAAGVHVRTEVPAFDQSSDIAPAASAGYRSCENDAGIAHSAPASIPADAEGLVPACKLNTLHACKLDTLHGSPESSNMLESTPSLAEGVNATACTLGAVEQSKGTAEQVKGNAEELEGKINLRATTSLLRILQAYAKSSSLL